MSNLLLSLHNLFSAKHFWPRPRLSSQFRRKSNATYIFIQWNKMYKQAL
jgi:hypothetical protein